MTKPHVDAPQRRLMPLRASWGGKADPAALAVMLSGARGRLAVRPASDAAWTRAALMPLGKFAAQAAEELQSPWPQPLVSHYARYFRDGNRTEYEALVGARQQRLTRAVVMAALPAAPGHVDPDAWLDEVIDGANLLCEQSSWSWAAHDDVFSVSGAVVPDVERPYLDLGAGEVAAQLAWLDLVLGERLDERAPGLRGRLRHETHRRVILPFLERLDWHWLGLHGDVHNWNPWIHSNVIVAALLLVDDPQLQGRTIARCIEGLDRFLASIPADGAIDEGFAYWWNGAGRALEGLAVLEEASAGALNADLPVIHALVAFPQRMHLGHQWFLNVADGPARAAEGLPWDMLHRWAVRLGDTEAARHAAAFIRTGPDPAAGLGRVLHWLLASGPDDPNTTAQPPLSSFTYLPSVQIMVARQCAGTTTGLVLAAKGGHNGEHHNHRDVGSVVVAVDGVPLLVDAGQPTYTAQTFGPDRYRIRAMQSAWHNVPAPFGLEQGTGRTFAAAVLSEPEPQDPKLVLGLGEAYGFDRPESWIRSSRLNADQGTVEIEDRWELPAQGGDVDITYLVAGTFSVDSGAGAFVRPEGIPGTAGLPATGGIPVSGRGLQLRWDLPAAVLLMDEWTLDDPLLSDVWGPRLTRLRFRMPAEFRATGAFTLTMEALDEH